MEVEKSNGYSGLILCKIGPDKQLYFLKGVAMQKKLYKIASKNDSRITSLGKIKRYVETNQAPYGLRIKKLSKKIYLEGQFAIKP